MNFKNKSFLGIPVAILALSLIGAAPTGDGCESNEVPSSASGVKKAEVKITTGSDGFTVEQRNIRDRLLKDNEPGSVKHLYVISAMTGDVLIYSTVRGKATSGSKRLTPTTVMSIQNEGSAIPVNIGGRDLRTLEVLGDDGSYGVSGEYLFWFSSNGVYHQQYTNGCIIHISDQPLPIKHIILNMELSKDNQDDTTPAVVSVQVKKAGK